MKNILFAFTVSLFLGLASCTYQKRYFLSSPDSSVSMTFQVLDGIPYYDISYQGKPVVLSSRLGMLFSDTSLFAKGYEVFSVDTAAVSKKWTPVYGITSQADNTYHRLRVMLKERSGNHTMGIEFRLYDDGAAFRYFFPSNINTVTKSLISEETEFVFPGDEVCFAAKRKGFRDSYENLYEPAHFSDLTPADLIGCPFLVKEEGHWVALTEAALDNYAGMSLKKGEKKNVFRAVLAPYPGKKCSVCALPARSPWRVFLIGKRAGDMMNSTLILNLNEPRKITDVSWIKPGKATWPWWNNRITNVPEVHSGEPSTAVMKYYTDFAARNGIPYLVVDAGWYSLEGDAWSQPEKEDVLTMEETRKSFYNIHQVIDYAKKKKVGVFLWVHYASLKDRIDTVLSTYANWGAVGIKLDNFGGEDQLLVNTLHKIIRTAARYHLMVDYHGAYKPTGYTRTWPNFMTCEAVRGMEYSKGPGGKITPQHTVTIPYTRMLAGPMDFTPGVFDLDGTKRYPKYVEGTRARQIAMYVVYYSPLQMLPDYPAAYEGSPAQFAFLREVPVTWDETKFIDGYPGDYVVLARRKGNRWYVGLMTDENPRTINLRLDFLSETTRYHAMIVKDGKNVTKDPQNVTIEERNVTRSDILHIRLAGGGGAVLRFIPL